MVVSLYTNAFLATLRDLSSRISNVLSEVNVLDSYREDIIVLLSRSSIFLRNAIVYEKKRAR
jgi:hypothetical protein